MFLHILRSKGPRDRNFAHVSFSPTGGWLFGGPCFDPLSWAIFFKDREASGAFEISDRRILAKAAGATSSSRLLRLSLALLEMPPPKKKKKDCTQMALAKENVPNEEKNGLKGSFQVHRTLKKPLLGGMVFLRPRSPALTD